MRVYAQVMAISAKSCLYREPASTGSLTILVSFSQFFDIDLVEMSQHGVGDIFICLLYNVDIACHIATMLWALVIVLHIGIINSILVRTLRLHTHDNNHEERRKIEEESYIEDSDQFVNEAKDSYKAAANLRVPKPHLCVLRWVR